MLDDLVVLLGGRVAEALVLDDISTGASNDIERATKTARAMVTKYGMSETLGPITYGSDNSEPFLGRDMGHIRDYSESTCAAIDSEIKRIVSCLLYPSGTYLCNVKLHPGGVAKISVMVSEKE